MKISEIIELIKSGENERIEFKSRFTKEGIAETVCAMLNTDGGVILIGVDDHGKIIGIADDRIIERITSALGAIEPYPKVRVGKIRIDDKDVAYIEVAKSRNLHSYRKVVYIRVGASNRPLSVSEIIERASESLLVFFDELPSNAPSNALNTEYIRDYLMKREKIRGVSYSDKLDEIMRSLRILVKRNSHYVPSNGGLLFFSENPQQYIPNAKVRLIWFKDNEMREYRDAREFTGPLWRIVDEIERYFIKNMRRIGGELIGWRRVDLMEYPIRALREAITNALIHRNYFDPSEVLIFVFPDRIVIRNPGSFPPGVTIEDPIHKPRNPLLAQYMYDIGYIEKYGIGIKLILSECKRHPLVDVEFKIRPFVTEVIFKKLKESPILDEYDRKIYQLLKERGVLSSSEIAQIVGLSKPSVLKRIEKLIALDLVEAIGKGAGRKYRVKPL